MSFESLLQNSGGLFAGHTAFANGWHGDGWVEKGFVVRNPAVFDQVALLQAQVVRERFPQVEVLVGCASVGAIVASYVARHLNIPFAATFHAGNDMGFHRMYVPEPGTKVCVMEDLVFTGAEVMLQAELFKRSGIEMLGLVAWMVRGSASLGDLPVASLSHAPFSQWLAADCPLCAAGEEIVHSNIRE